MRSPLPALILGMIAPISLCAQSPAPATEPAPAPELEYGKRRLESFPRDERGLLLPEIWDIVKAEAERNPNSNEARTLKDRHLYQAFYQTYADWTPPEPRQAPAGRLASLSDTPKTPRFPLTGKVWPAAPGEASVCLWEDDKLAAMSLGIDDNCAPDIPYWKELSKKYNGLNITWNIITGNIEGAIDKVRGPMSGTWETWRKLTAEGYRVTSHSLTHLQNPVLADGWPGPDWETSESRRQISANIPGVETNVFVYPGAGVRAFGILGGYYPHSSWRPSVVKYYAAARGGGGNPLNQANMIDYFNIRSTTGVLNILDNADPKVAEYNLNNLFAADPAHPHHKYYRGWASVFIHYINAGRTFDTDLYTVAFSKVLAFYDEHREDLWTGFFEDVALYGQERDTATLVTNESTDRAITYTLTTKLDPAVFHYPLTIKVRLPDAWKSVSAQQNATPIPAKLIIHEGAPYALVKSVPDKGQVRLAPGEAGQ
jgi:hypothetical protein